MKNQEKEIGKALIVLAGLVTKKDKKKRKKKRQ